MKTILHTLESHGINPRRKSAGEYSAPCPFCKDGNDRFCIWPEQDRYWCRQCGKKGDSVQLLRDLDGLSYEDAKAALGIVDHGEKAPEKPPRKPQEKPKRGKEPFVHPELGKPEKLWKYLDEAGEVLFCIARFQNC